MRPARTAAHLVKMVRAHTQHTGQTPYRDGFPDDMARYAMAQEDFDQATEILSFVNKAKDELIQTGYFVRPFVFTTVPGYAEYELSQDVGEITHVTVCGDPLRQVTIGGMDTDRQGWQRYPEGAGGAVYLSNTPEALAQAQAQQQGAPAGTTLLLSGDGDDPGDGPGDDPDALSFVTTTGAAPVTATPTGCPCARGRLGRPRLYYTYSDMIGLDPAPDRYYDVVVLAERVPPDLAERTDPVLYLPSVAHDALASRAAWWLCNLDAENDAAARRMPALDADWKYWFDYLKRMVQERTTSEDDQIRPGGYRDGYGWRGGW